MPFNALDLTVDDDKCDLSYSKDGEIFQKFKLQDTRRARALKLLWLKLKEIDDRKVLTAKRD